MKLSTKFTLCATILSLASPCAIAVGGNNQGTTQLRGAAVAAAVVTDEQALLNASRRVHEEDQGLT